MVSVTSTAHHTGRSVDAANPHLHSTYGEWNAYGQSKLANYRLAIGLQRRFTAAGVAAASLLAHPGLSDTELRATSVAETGGGLSQKFFHTMARNVGMSAARGARPSSGPPPIPPPAAASSTPMFGNNEPPVRRRPRRWLGLDKKIRTL